MKNSIINSVHTNVHTSNVLLGATLHNRVQSVLHSVYFLGLFVSATEQTLWQAYKEKERGRKRKRDLWVRA